LLAGDPPEQTRGWLADEGWDVEAATLLGHDGRDPAPDYSLSSYVDDLLARQPGPWDLVIAHSLGGSVATLAAAGDPAWTRSLTLLDPVWWVPEEDRDAVIADQVSELSLTPSTLTAAKPHWHPRDVEAKLAAVASVDPAAAERSFLDTGEWDLHTAVAALSVRTLVLAGDPTVYSMLQPEPWDDNPQVEIIRVAGAGHSPHRDKPDTTRLLLGF
jgi:pimeloyl-ACP methyl ester carboxylesterase